MTSFYHTILVLVYLICEPMKKADRTNLQCSTCSTLCSSELCAATFWSQKSPHEAKATPWLIFLLARTSLIPAWLRSRTCWCLLASRNNMLRLRAVVAIIRVRVITVRLQGLQASDVLYHTQEPSSAGTLLSGGSQARAPCRFAFRPCHPHAGRCG